VLTGVHNSELIRAYMSVDWRARALALIVKAWAKARRINDSSLNTLSSFSYTLMVIFFLQRRGVLPCLQSPALLEAYEKWRGSALPVIEAGGFRFRYCADQPFLTYLCAVSVCEGASRLTWLDPA
jgi:hypothetical protein